MRSTILRQFGAASLRRDERGVVLALVLVVMCLLLGVGSTSLFSGYTNLLASTNLKLATRAANTAEAAVNEAIYRLSRQEGKPGVIVSDLTPDWQVQILPSGTPTSSAQVASIQKTGDWGDYAADTPPVTLQYKKDANGKVIFYDPNIDSPPCNNPPFCTIQLPAASIPNNARPVIQILATGLDSREARRQILAEAVETTAFAPPAPLSSGVDVNLSGSGFIDGVNHDHRIYITAGSGSGAIYGDTSSETTDTNPIKDSPDDTQFDTGGHDIANPGLLLAPYLYPAYSAYPRLFNKQISMTDPTTPAWVRLAPLIGGTWGGVNQGYVSAVALSNGPTVLNDQPPTSGVWTRGVFSWRANNKNGLGAIPAYPSTCSPAGTPTLVCTPTALTHSPDSFSSTSHFPFFQEFLGLDGVSFQNLLAKSDTTSADLAAGRPPLGFTYIQGNYTFNASTASPGTNDFGLLYVTGDLTINGNQTFKGLIFVDGSLNVSGSPTILGAVMVRGSTQITAGTGNMTLLYSRKAAELGIESGHPWRLLSWADTEMQ